MKRLCLFALLFIPSLSTASEYVLGTDGLYYWEGVPYSRTFVAGYYAVDHRGCRTWVPGYYSYAKVVVAAKAATNPNDWRQQLLKIKQEQVEHQNYLDSLRFLGLDAPQKQITSLYGQASVQVGNYGVNGTTIYGLSSLNDVYGSDFLGIGLQQYNRGLDRVQDLHGSALAGLGQLLSTEGANRARVAEIVAVGQLLQSLRQEGKLEAKSEFKFKLTPEGKAELIPVEPKQDVFKEWNKQANEKCASCHFGDRASLKGGFDISTWPGLPASKKMDIAVKYLLTTDQTKIMPRTSDGKPGTPISERDVMDIWMRVTSNKQ